MTEYIREPQRQIPVSGNYDVAVVGGGVAGIAAALAVKTGTTVRKVDAQTIRSVLKENGAYL